MKIKPFIWGAAAALYVTTVYLSDNRSCSSLLTPVPSPNYYYAPHKKETVLKDGGIEIPEVDCPEDQDYEPNNPGVLEQMLESIRNDPEDFEIS